MNEARDEAVVIVLSFDATIPKILLLNTMRLKNVSN